MAGGSRPAVPSPLVSTLCFVPRRACGFPLFGGFAALQRLDEKPPPSMFIQELALRANAPLNPNPNPNPAVGQSQRLHATRQRPRRRPARTTVATARVSAAPQTALTSSWKSAVNPAPARHEAAKCTVWRQKGHQTLRQCRSLHGRYRAAAIQRWTFSRFLKRVE